MTEQNYFEFQSLKFVHNLLRHRPLVLNRIDVDDALRAIARRLNLPEREDLLKQMIKHADVTDYDRAALKAAIFEDDTLGARVTKFVTMNDAFVAAALSKALSALVSRSKPDKSHEVEAKLSDLAANLKLPKSEMELLILLVLGAQKLGVFEDAFYESSIWDAKHFAVNLPAFLGIEASLCRQMLSTSGNLYGLGLITRSSHNEPFSIDTRLDDWLTGSNMGRTFTEAMFESIDVSTMSGVVQRPPNVTDDDWDLLTGSLRPAKGMNLLFHGEPGTGKTTLAKALAQHLGLDIISIPNPADGSFQQRLAAVQCAAKIVAGCPNKVVLVDEADRLLCTSHSWQFFGVRSDKGQLNKFLESNQARIIWITNSLRGADASCLRRFAYSLEFRPHTHQQREVLWQSAVAALPELREIISPDELRGLSQAYPLQPGQVVDSLRHIVGLGLARERVLPTLKKLLESHSQRLQGSRTSKTQETMRPSRHTNLSGINTDACLPSIVKTTTSFYSYLETAGEAPEVRNMNILLSGPPGTGKTEFVKYLAQQTGRDLVVRTASDLLNKYVGETEKLIAKAFAEAEEARALLFIDEADSILCSRDRAQASWQVSQTNELLCRMEQFRGILVCATNHADLLDSAAIRRFNFKVRFDWLTAAGAVTFFERLLAPLVSGASLTPDQVSRLKNLKQLAPGDFKIVRQQSLFRQGEDLNSELLLNMLTKEVSHKSGIHGSANIGFGVP